MNPANPEGTFQERLRKRNAVVRDVFAKFKKARQEGYVNHRLEHHQPVSCSCSNQHSHKSCPDQHSFDAGYEVIDVGTSGSVQDIKKGPPLPSNIFNWLIGAGRGQTVGGSVWGRAKLTTDEANKRVTADIEALRKLLLDEKLPDDRVQDPT
jgi:hypothetical protein